MLPLGFALALPFSTLKLTIARAVVLGCGDDAPGEQAGERGRGEDVENVRHGFEKSCSLSVP